LFCALSRGLDFISNANPACSCVYICKFQFRPITPPPLGDYHAPTTRLASPLAREAFQVLGPGRTSPKARDRPRRTSVARLRAWTELSGKPFSNSLHPRLPKHPVKLSDPFD
jgi:hypothetical protein